MKQITSAAAGDTQFYSITLGAFAMIALLLGAMGMYSVLSPAVAECTHEIGIRIALGAEQ